VCHTQFSSGVKVLQQQNSPPLPKSQDGLPITTLPAQMNPVMHVAHNIDTFPSSPASNLQQKNDLLPLQSMNPIIPHPGMIR
jgi:hypothetical protein